MSLKVLLCLSRPRGLILWAISEHTAQIAGDIAVTIAFFPAGVPLLSKSSLVTTGMQSSASPAITLHFPLKKEICIFLLQGLCLFFFFSVTVAHKSVVVKEDKKKKKNLIFSYMFRLFTWEINNLGLLFQQSLGYLYRAALG